MDASTPRFVGPLHNMGPLPLFVATPAVIGLSSPLGANAPGVLPARGATAAGAQAISASLGVGWEVVAILAVLATGAYVFLKKGKGRR